MQEHLWLCWKNSWLLHRIDFVYNLFNIIILDVHSACACRQSSTNQHENRSQNEDPVQPCGTHNMAWPWKETEILLRNGSHGARIVRPLPCEEQRLASQTARGRYLGLGGCVGERRRRWRQRSPVVEQDVMRAVRGIGGGVATTPSGGLAH
jgi:hypothetical protein